MPDGGQSQAPAPAPAASDQIPFDLNGARAAGYSDRQIADYLGGEANFNVVGARKAGYGDDAIVNHLAAQPTPPPAPPEPPQTSAAGAFTHAAEAQVLPAAGGMAAAGMGAKLGAVLGAAIPGLGETGIGEGLGALGGGIAGYFAGADAVESAQKGLLNMLPDSVARAIGQDPETQKAEQEQHPEAARFGGLAPQLLYMRPGAVEAAAEGATGLAKVMANPIASRVLGAGVNTALEAAQEHQQGDGYDPESLLIAAGTGAFLNRETQLGQKISGAGPNAIRWAWDRTIGQPKPQVAPDPDVMNAGNVDDAINAARQATQATGAPIDVDQHASNLEATGDDADLAQAKLLRMFDNTGAGAVEQTQDGGYQFRTTDRAGNDVVHPIAAWDPHAPADTDAGGQSDRTSVIPAANDEATRQRLTNAGYTYDPAAGEWFIDTPRPGQPPATEAPTISAATADTISQHYAQAGVHVVFYKDDKAIPFDGSVDPQQPNTLFLSNNPVRNIAQVAGHEFTHVLSDTELPDGTNLGDLLNEQVAAGMTPVGRKYAQEKFGVTAPVREAYPEGDAGTAAHAVDYTRHMVTELAADIGGEAPQFQSFMPRVVQAVQARFGNSVAAGVMTKLIDGLQTAMTTIRGLFGEKGTRSQLWVSNIGEIHDTLAQMYATKFGGEAERQAAAEATARDAAERGRYLAPPEAGPTTPPPGPTPAGPTPAPKPAGPTPTAPPAGPRANPVATDGYDTNPADRIRGRIAFLQNAVDTDRTLTASERRDFTGRIAEFQGYIGARDAALAGADDAHAAAVRAIQPGDTITGTDRHGRSVTGTVDSFNGGGHIGVTRSNGLHSTIHAGDVTDIRPMGAAPGAAPKPAAPSSTGLAEMGGGMAQGMGEALRASLWAKLQAGDTTEAGAPSNLMILAVATRKAGGLQTEAVFRQFLDAVAPLLDDRSPGWQDRFRDAARPFLPRPTAPAGEARTNTPSFLSPGTAAEQRPAASTQLTVPPGFHELSDEARALRLRRWLADLTDERAVAAEANGRLKILRQTEAGILRTVGGDETALDDAGRLRLAQVRAQIEAATQPPTADTPEMEKVRTELAATAARLRALRTEQLAIADQWDQLGMHGMATAVRLGAASPHLTRENVDFAHRKLAAEIAKRQPDAPKPAETFSLAEFMAGGTTGDKAALGNIEVAGSPEARAIVPRVQAVAQALTDRMNALGFTRMEAGQNPPAAVGELRSQFSDVLATFSRFASVDIARAKGHKRGTPEAWAAAWKAAEDALHATGLDTRAPVNPVVNPVVPPAPPTTGHPSSHNWSQEIARVFREEGHAGASDVFNDMVRIHDLTAGQRENLLIYTRAAIGDRDWTPTAPEKPVAPTGAAPSRQEQILAELDARQAPDIEYKAAFSTGQKNPLRAGETWRQRLVDWVAAQKAYKPPEAPPAAAAPAPAPAGEAASADAIHAKVIAQLRADPALQKVLAGDANVGAGNDPGAQQTVRKAYHATLNKMLADLAERDPASLSAFAAAADELRGRPIDMATVREAMEPPKPKPPEAPPAAPPAPPPVPPTAAPQPTAAPPPNSAPPPKAEAAPKPTPRPADYGANNKLVSNEAYAEIRAQLRAKLNGQLNAGIDPETFALGAQAAIYHLESGARRFADYARAMVEDFGKAARPFLRGWYENARYYPGHDSAGMSEHAEIEEYLRTEAANEQGTDGADGGLGEPGGGEVGGGGNGDGQPEGGRPDRPLEDIPPGDGAGLGGPGAGDVGETGVRPGSEAIPGAGNVHPGGDADTGRGGGSDEGLADDGTGNGNGRKPTPAPTRPNFHIDDPETLIGGTPKVRFARNRAALQALADIEAEQRAPSHEELQAMAGYIGWGSFGQDLFKGTYERQPPRPGWDAEAQWLREHLGKEQWESAQRSIINAHFTDPPTVKAMWDMVRNMGFKGGRVLEPSMGIGNFFGLMPRDLMAASSLTGIELDSVTGRMAKLLYPDAGIHIKGYEQSSTPDNFYDLTIGNWPFAAQSPADRRYDRMAPSLHDYFFLKALDQTRPGGLVVGITSSGTMDKAGRAVRLELARKGDLLASFRLPSGAFEKYAGTSVVTDIIVLRKRGTSSESPSLEPWIESSAMDTPAGMGMHPEEKALRQIRVNQYYQDRPDAVLGQLDFGTGTTQGKPGMIVHRPDDLMQRLERLPSLVPADGYSPNIRGNEPRFLANNTTDRTGSIIVHPDGKLYQVAGDQMLDMADTHPKLLTGTAKEVRARINQMRSLVDLRRGYGALIDAERDGKPETETLRQALAKQFTDFRDTHGKIGDSAGLELMNRAKDPGYAMVRALERPDGTPSRILSEPTVRSRRSLDNPTIPDAYIMARNEQSILDMDRVAELARVPREAAAQYLLDAGAILRTPGGGYEPADQHLSGNVRKKLAEAQQALTQGEPMQATVDRLTEALPETVPYFTIEAKLGAPWVGDAAYKSFIGELLGLPAGETRGISVQFVGNRWKVALTNELRSKPEAELWGHKEFNFDAFIGKAMGNETLRVMDPADRDGGPYFNAKASEEANAKAQALREKFTDWAWADPERKIAFERAYNQTMNAIAKPKFDGSFMDLSGMALRRGEDAFSLRRHQVNAIWRGVVQGRGLFAHEVGTGKTYTMGGIAVEGRRYGVFRKPLLFAHNANSATVAREINEMYPGARVHYVDNLSPKNIQTEMYRIANEDWDLVVMPHSLIDRMSLKRETLMELAAEDIANLEAEAIEAAESDGYVLTPEMMGDKKAMGGVRSPTAKQLVKARQAILTRIEKDANRSSKEDAIPFEQLGVDAIMVDEAHIFKKPPYVATRMKVKGLNTQPSNRSIGLGFLTSYVKRANNGRNVYLFTGTPITNALNEIFNQSRYFMDDRLEQAGIKQWDAWFNTFAAAEPDVELTAGGDFESVTRLAKFDNVDELVRLMSEFTDVVQAKDMPEFIDRATPDGKTLKSPDLTPEEKAFLTDGRTPNPPGRPYKRIIMDVGEMSPAQREVLADIRERIASFKAMSGKDRWEAMQSGDRRSPIITDQDGPKASLDVRNYDPDAPDDPGSKVNRAVRNVLRIYQEPGAAQMIFMETGYNAGVSQKGRDHPFILARDLVDKLVQGGIPRGEIAIVAGGVTPEQKKLIADKMNDGRLRVAIGQTETLGTGVNAQRQLRAIHHMDAPWRPGDLEQRNGRGERQGNEWNTMQEYRYLTEGIDGRRWQVLNSKSGFIKKFINAFNDTSGKRLGTMEVDADALGDEEDMSQTLSAAAGDPRIMLRAKYKADVNRLERRERLHTVGQADALEQVRRSQLDQRRQLQDAERYTSWGDTWNAASQRAQDHARAAGDTRRWYEVQGTPQEAEAVLTARAAEARNQIAQVQQLIRDAQAGPREGEAPDTPQQAANRARRIATLTEKLPTLTAQAEHASAAAQAARGGNGIWHDGGDAIQARIDEGIKGLERAAPGTSIAEVPRQTLATVNGFPITAKWFSGNPSPNYFINDPDGAYVAQIDAPTMPRIIPRMSQLHDAAEASRFRAGEAAKSIEQLRKSATLDFPQREALQNKRMQLAKLEDDLQANPTPPPGWLRHGAPMDSTIYVNGEPREVRGHHMSDDYYLGTDQGDVPYLDARDENGQRIFDVHPPPPQPAPKEVPEWIKPLAESVGGKVFWHDDKLAVVRATQYGEKAYLGFKEGVAPEHQGFNIFGMRGQFFTHDEHMAMEAGVKEVEDRERNRAKLRKPASTFQPTPGLEWSTGEAGGRPRVQFSPRQPEDERRTPLYSALTRGVENIKQEKATPGQWIATLKNMAGVKAEERAWTGLDDWLGMQPKSVTKAEVLDYLRANQLDVREVMKGAPIEAPEIAAKRDRFQALMDRDDGRGAPLTPAEDAEATRLSAELAAHPNPWLTENARTQYAQYQLPGGANYREMLITLPAKARADPDGGAALRDAMDRYQEVSGQFGPDDPRTQAALRQYRKIEALREPAQQYRSGHWSEPNVLAHTRFADRTASDGARVLHIEELQSDWHQAGRKRGYDDPAARATEIAEQQRRVDAANRAAAETKRRSEEASAAVNAMLADPVFAKALKDSNDATDKAFDDMNMNWHRIPVGPKREAFRAEASATYDRLATKHRADLKAYHDALSAEAQAAYANSLAQRTAAGEEDALSALRTNKRSGIVPNAPFKTTWPALVMKRMTQYAVDHGYDRVAWTPGDAQAERYDLSKQVSGVSWQPSTGELYVHHVGADDYESEPIATGVTKERLADHVGKDVAETMLAREPDDEGYHVAQGSDLRIGGQGMRGFYDKQLPSEVQRIIGKFGGKVGESEISLPVTEGRPTEPDDTARRDHARALAAIDDQISQAERDGDSRLLDSLHEQRAELQQRMIDETKDRAADPRATAKVHSFDITEKMREAVRREGMPLFSPRITGAERETEAYTPEEIRAYTNVGRVTNEPTWRERLKAATSDLGRRFIQQVLDPYIGVKADDPAGYMALRNANSTSGALLRFMTDGTLRFDGSVYAMADRNGGVEHYLVRPLHGEQDRFIWWVAANRAERLSAEDRENLWSQDDIDTIKRTNLGQVPFDYTLPDGTITRSREAIYNDSLRKLDVFNRNVLDLAVEAGLLDADRVSALFSNPFYVPFYRMAEGDSRFVGPNLSSGFVKKSAFKTLTGGAEKLNHDLWNNAIGNWSHMIDASLRNRAAAGVLDVGVTNGAVVERTAREVNHMMSKKEKEGLVWVMNGGEKQYFQVTDPMLYTAITALDFTGFRNPIMDAMTKFKTVFTMGVTADPRFMLRVAIKDAEQAIAIAPTSWNIVRNIVQGFRMGDLPGALQNVARAAAGRETQRLNLSDEAADAMAGGATMHLGSGHDTGARKVNIRTMLDSPTKIGAFWNWIATTARAAKEVSAQSEDVQRLALFANMRAAGASREEAAFAGRDLEDFTLRGAAPVVRAITQMVPFLNAAMQGLYKVGRAAADADRNIAVAVGGRIAASTTRRVATVMAATTVLTLALDAIYADDEDYKKRTDDDRNTNFWFKVGDTQFRIPMGFEIAALSRIAANGVEAFFGQSEMTGRRFLNNTASILANNLYMSPVPQAVAPLVDIYANKGYGGAPIVPRSMDKLQAQEQYTPASTVLAKSLSAAGNAAARGIAGPQAQFLAPVQIDYLVNGYFGWLGSMVTGVADTAVRAADQAQAAARGVAPMEPVRPSRDLWNFALRGMVSTEPTPASRYVDMLYTQADAVNRAFETYHSLANQGRADDARAFFNENKNLIGLHDMIASVTRQETQINQQIKRIEVSRTLTADQKHDQLARLNAMRNKAAEQVFNAERR